MLTYSQALTQILTSVDPLPPTTLPLAAALGKVLAESATSRWDLPGVDNSAMDGFAFRYAGQAPGDILPVTGSIYAGDSATTIPGPGEAVRIMTGAALPEGCDTVVPIEAVTESGKQIRLDEPVRPGQHVRPRGEEVRQGETIVASGALLHAGDIGLMAAAGIEQVRVHPQPQVAILSTGNELVNLGDPLLPGQIINSNQHLLQARLDELGYPCTPLGVARDDRDEIERSIAEGLTADLLLTTGGVSIGDRDFIQEVLARRGFDLGFWKVAIKPGKPVLFGRVDRCPVFGLPGNPAAAAATFELFVRPALARLAGQAAPLHPTLRAELTADVRDAGKRQAFLWGELSEREPGDYRFTPSHHQGSNRNRAVQSASALLPVAAGAGTVKAGSAVEVLVLRLPGRQQPVSS